MGPIAMEAAYYHSPHCRRRDKPWERTLRLKQKASVTLASEEIVALAGLLGSFADGAERVLQKLAGLRVSESTVQSTTEAVGQQVRKQLDKSKSLGSTRDWTW